MKTAPKLSRITHGPERHTNGNGKPKPAAIAVEPQPEFAPDQTRPIRLDRIEFSPSNPRKRIDEVELQGLAESIVAKGVLQPILVRPLPAPCDDYFVRDNGETLMNRLAPDPLRDTPAFEVVWRKAAAGQDSVAAAFYTIIDAQDEAARLNAFEGKKLATHFELVMGERRVRASRLAGMKVIDAKVRDLSDREVLEIQIIENDQREDTTALEKAEGYHQLMTKHNVGIDALAGRVGKSVSTIRGLLKLLELPPLAREAVAAGRIPMSTAQLIARVAGDHARQEVAFRVVKGDRWGRFKIDAKLLDKDKDTPLSVRDTEEMIRDAYMRELKQAPFSRKSLDLVPAAGSCDDCKKRTGNNPDDFPGARADVCTDPGCYRDKCDAHAEQVKAKAHADGKTVLPEKVAQELFSGNSLRYNASYIELGDNCEYDKKRRTWRKLIGPHVNGEAVWAQDGTGTMHELVPKTAAHKILAKEHGIKPSSTYSGDASYRNRQAAERKKTEARKKIAAVANAAVAHKVEKAFGIVLGICTVDAAPLLANLVIAMAECSWSDACHAVAKRRALPGKDDRTKITEYAQSLGTVGELLGLFAEIVAARKSLHWSSTYGGGVGGADEKRFWQAFGVDAGKLLKGAK